MPLDQESHIGVEIRQEKAHKHKLFGLVAIGTNPLCPRDKRKFSPYFTEWKPSLSEGQTQFVSGAIPGTKGGRKSLCVQSLCAFFAR